MSSGRAARACTAAIAAWRPYALQAASAAVHGRAARAEETAWSEISTLYGLLAKLDASPVVELNRAIAVAMAGDLEAGLAQVAALERGGSLASYYLLSATAADLLRRLGRFPEAASHYRRALERVGTGPERRYLERRLAEVSSAGS